MKIYYIPAFYTSEMVMFPGVWIESFRLAVAFDDIYDANFRKRQKGPIYCIERYVGKIFPHSFVHHVG